MSYDFFPAIDGDHNFAPEVRAALAKTPELRNTVIPMATAQRDAITADQLWDGRLILNTDIDRVERYDATDTSWSDYVEISDLVKLLTSTFVPESPSGSGAVGSSDEAARADHVHPSAAQASITDVFTASGTWTKRAGATRVEVKILSGGGGGASATSGYGYAGGGGGGGCSLLTLDPATLSTTVPVTVGSGGTASSPGTSGTYGGASSFGSAYSVTGGAGGVYNGPTYGSVIVAAGGGLGKYHGGGDGGGYANSMYGAGSNDGGGGGGGGNGQYTTQFGGSGGLSMTAGKGGSGGMVAPAIPGAVPAGGGGGGLPGANGARGEVRVTTYF